MSLGGLSNNLNNSGRNTFNDARARMMQEKEARDRELHTRMLDREKHEVSHRKLEHQRVTSEIEKLRRTLVSLKRGVKDTKSLDMVRNTESQLRSLEGEAKMIDQDIRMKTLEIQRHGGKSF